MNRIIDLPNPFESAPEAGRPAAAAFVPKPGAAAVGPSSPEVATSAPGMARSEFESQAKATEGKAGMAGDAMICPVRRSTAGTGLRVGVSGAGLTATSEFMGVTAGETAPSFSSLNSFSGIGSAREASAMLHPGVVDGPTTSLAGRDSGDRAERRPSNLRDGASEEWSRSAPGQPQPKAPTGGDGVERHATNSPVSASETRGGAGDDCSVGKRGVWPHHDGQACALRSNVEPELDVTARRDEQPNSDVIDIPAFLQRNPDNTFRFPSA